jgi:hypothetical protein
MGTKAPVTGGGMHSHDRTMIAKLGFADGDRRNDEHDLACQYLMDGPVSSLVLDSIAMPPFEALAARRFKELAEQRARAESGMTATELSRLVGKGAWEFSDLTLGVPAFAQIETATEVPLHKGDGQYQTTLGFLDVAIAFRMFARVGGRQFRATYAYDTPDGKWAVGATARWEPRWADFEERIEANGRAVIEVKIGEVPLGEAIRQVKFYRSFSGETSIYTSPPCFRLYILATRYELSEHDTDVLRNEQIHHLHLGDGFTAWLEARRKEAAPSKTSIRL